MDQNGEAVTVTHRLWDTAGPSETTAALRLKCLPCRRGCLSIFSVSYCVLHSPPAALFASAKRKPPPPTPFPLEFTGSLPRHGNDVIERKKWSAKKESLREWRTQWCYTASTLRPITLQRRGSKPSHPLSAAACLLLFRVMRWWCHCCNVFFT